MNDPGKPYELELEIRPDYLYVKVHSPTTSKEIVVAYLHEIIEHSMRLGRDRLLLERDIPATLQDSDVHMSNTEFAHTGIEFIKMAVIDPRSENAEGVEYAIHVQNNRGAHMKYFDSLSAAENWLLTF